MKTIALSLLLLSFSAFAKSADDYLNEGAYQYIAERTQEASVTVDEGLQQYPDDPKLQNLSELLKQMKNQQRQDQNQNGGGDSKQNQKDQKNKNDENKNDQNKNDQNKNDQNKNGQNKDQQNKDSQNKGQNPNKPDQDKKDQQQQQPKPEDQNGQPHDTSGQQGQGAPAKRLPGQMSKDEAERLLNSYIDEEKQAQQNRQEVPKKRVEPGQQDW